MKQTEISTPHKNFGLLPKGYGSHLSVLSRKMDEICFFKNCLWFQYEKWPGWGGQGVQRTRDKTAATMLIRGQVNPA